MKSRQNKLAFSLLELIIGSLILILIISTSFSLLSNSTVSFNVQEAAVQAQEHARQAINQIANELRHSTQSRVFISDEIGITVNNNEGHMLNFQIPVQDTNGALLLTTDGTLVWGNRDRDGNYHADDSRHRFCIVYHSENLAVRRRSTGCGREDSDRVNNIWALERGAYDANNNPDRRTLNATLAQDITHLHFSRDPSHPALINIEVTAQARTIGNQVVERTLQQTVRLRN
jgi:type II secretory pathway pseudopilin PulG